MIRNGWSRIPVLLFFLGYRFVSSSALEISSPPTLPDAVKGEPYNFQLQVEGAAGEVAWSVDTGEMDYAEVETPHHFAEPADAVRVTYQRYGALEFPFVFPYYGVGYRKTSVRGHGNMGPRYRLSSPYPSRDGSLTV